MSQSDETLRDIPILSDLSDETLDRLEERAWEVEGKKDSPIYFADDTPNLVYFLMDGRVRLLYTTSEEQDITLEYLERGDLFGELSLTDFETRGQTAQTLESSLLKVVPGDFFREMMESDPELFSRIFDYLIKRRQKIQNRLRTLVYEDARKKVMYVLLDLSGNLLMETRERSNEVVSTTHQEISQMAGLARPTTTKMLNKLNDEGLINSDDEGIEIVDPIKMREAIDLIR